jgi:hypothetical protein
LFPSFSAGRAGPAEFKSKSEVLFMPTIINKADARKTVRDASDDMEKAGTNSAAADGQAARGASEASGDTVRNDRVASSRAVTRKNAEAAKQSFQKAAEDLHGTTARSVEAITDVVDASREMSERADEQLARILALRDKTFKELIGRTQRNLSVMIQTGIRLADGYQSIMREWADYTRNAMQCNIVGMNSIMRARAPQDFVAAQSELLNAEVQVMLNSGVRISEATLQVARDAAQNIAERTKQRDQQSSRQASSGP